jgi:hypothetical protein
VPKKTITLDDDDLALIRKVRKAIKYEDNGDPAKDVMSEPEMIDAMRLLLDVLPTSTGAQ